MMLFKRRSDASAVGEDPALPSVSVTSAEGETVVSLAGNWTTATVAEADPTIRRIEMERAGRLRIDLSGVGRLDTAGAWIIHRLVSGLEGKGASVALDGMSAEAETLIGAIRRSEPGESEAMTPPRDWLGISLL
jgi:phospholipid/cholesterol/gamma-HCH transport system permease protein